MHAPLRSALMALAATMLLVTASCSSTPEAAPSTAVSVTASAWVAPIPKSPASLLTEPSSASPLASAASSGVGGNNTTEAVPDLDVTVEPLPAGLSAVDQQQARAAIDAYSRYWSLTNRLGRNPAVDSASFIAAVATGSAARELEKSFERFREKGYRIEGQNSVDITVQRVEVGAVDLALCVDGSGGRLVDSTGTPVDDQADKETRRSGSARVGEYTSGWKVDTNVFHMDSSC